ncbi:MAG: sensor histidine kinase [Myxococcales bacterium]|nr:sensor histidine kinase [Myxococcales bacterium]
MARGAGSRTDLNGAALQGFLEAAPDAIVVVDQVGHVVIANRLNLLSNAAKYGKGKPIEVEAHRMNGTALVSVTDHGIGIDEEALSRIFGRFERAVSLRHFGGLGLLVARQLAEAHGGTLVAQSQPRAGSTFTLVLPIEPVLSSNDGASKLDRSA